LTIENKGWIDRGLRPLMRDWIFGCDVCQEVCPYNARAFETKWPEFSPSNGAGAWISLVEVLSSDEATFRARWGHTPLSRPKRRGLIRNACVVAGNSGDDALVPSLRSLLRDPEPIIRGHAFWGLSQLNRAAARAELDLLISDPDVTVQAEARGFQEAA
jgi:epoxyqueuosine reductase